MDWNLTTPSAKSFPFLKLFTLKNYHRNHRWYILISQVIVDQIQTSRTKANIWLTTFKWIIAPLVNGFCCFFPWLPRFSRQGTLLNMLEDQKETLQTQHSWLAFQIFCYPRRSALKLCNKMSYKTYKVFLKIRKGTDDIPKLHYGSYIIIIPPDWMAPERLEPLLLHLWLILPHTKYINKEGLPSSVLMMAKSFRFRLWAIDLMLNIHTEKNV